MVFIFVPLAVCTLLYFLISSLPNANTLDDFQLRKADKYGLFGLLIGLGSQSYMFSAIEKYGGISNVIALVCLAAIICGWVRFFIGWATDPKNNEKYKKGKATKQTHPFDAIYTEKYDPSSGASLVDESTEDLINKPTEDLEKYDPMSGASLSNKPKKDAVTFFNESIKEEVKKKKKERKDRSDEYSHQEELMNTIRQEACDILDQFSFPKHYTYESGSLFNHMWFSIWKRGLPGEDEYFPEGKQKRVIGVTLEFGDVGNVLVTEIDGKISYKITQIDYQKGDYDDDVVAPIYTKTIPKSADMTNLGDPMRLVAEILIEQIAIYESTYESK